jgi:hypothetical protein
VDPPVQAAKFKPEEWSKYFKQPDWIFSERLSQDQSKPLPSMKYQGTADDVEDSDADIMDIDLSTSPVQNIEPASATSKISSAPFKGQGATSIGAIPIGAATTAKPPVSDLKDVIAELMDNNTFAAQKTRSMGLKKIDEDLPSSSESSNASINKSNPIHTIEFPLPPALQTTRSQIFVDLYLSQFEKYCKEYINTTKELTRHFVTRDAELTASFDDRFAHHRAETTKKMGFATYMAKIKDDNKVLERWHVYQKKHLNAMEQCEKVRMKTMKLYQI